MSKNIIKAAFVTTFALMAGYCVYTSQQEKEMSDLAMANVEALASGESGGRGCTVDRNSICETSHNDYIDYRNL